MIDKHTHTHTYTPHAYTHNIRWRRKQTSMYTRARAQHKWRREEHSNTVRPSLILSPHPSALSLSPPWVPPFLSSFQLSFPRSTTPHISSFHVAHPHPPVPTLPVLPPPLLSDHPYPLSSLLLLIFHPPPSSPALWYRASDLMAEPE